MWLILACTSTEAPEPAPPAGNSPPIVAAPPAAPAPAAAGAPEPPPGWPAELPARLIRLTAEGEAWVVVRPCVGEPAALEVDGGSVWFLGETSVVEQGAYTGLLLNKAGYTLRYQLSSGPKEVKLAWGDATRTWLTVGGDRYAVPSAVGGRFGVRAAECGQ